MSLDLIRPYARLRFHGFGKADLSEPLGHQESLHFEFLLLRLKGQAGEAISLLDFRTVLSSNNLDRLRILVRDETDPVLVAVQRDGPLRTTDDLDGCGHTLGEIELQSKVVALLLLFKAGELGVTGYVVKRACDLRGTDNDIRLKLVDGLPEESSLAAFRRNGEA